MKDPERIAQLDVEATDQDLKRQKLGNEQLQPNFMRRKKQLTYYEPLEYLDSLPCISPVCDAAQIPSIAGTEAKAARETQFSMDFIIGSGNHVKSYLTFAAANVPLMENEMKLQQLIPSEDLNNPYLRVLKVMSYLDKCIIVNYATAPGEIKTSVTMIENKKLVIMREDRLSIKYDTETLGCFHAGNEVMIQVCRSEIRAVSTAAPSAEENKELAGPMERANRRVLGACHDATTNTVFTRVEVGDRRMIEAWSCPQLQPYSTDGITEESISAISVCNADKGANLLVIATEARGFKNSELLFYEIQPDRLKLAFRCSNIAEQLPILPNQITHEHPDLLQRALTDLSVDIANATTATGNQADNINQAADQRIFAQSHL